MYAAMGMRPDIAFATSTVAQFSENPGWAHWEAVKRNFRYLMGTKSLELTYGGENRGLVSYVDADGASQEHRRAISGYVFMVDGGAVSWSSKKQELVMLSTTEACYDFSYFVLFTYVFSLFLEVSRCRFDSLLFDSYRCHTIDSLHCRSTDS